MYSIFQIRIRVSVFMKFATIQKGCGFCGFFSQIKSLSLYNVKVLIYRITESQKGRG